MWYDAALFRYLRNGFVMQATLDCFECLMRQALRAARIATPDAHVQRRILDEVAIRIPELNLAKSPAVISMYVYELAAQLSVNADPYKEIRRAQNNLALRIEPELRALVQQSNDPLLTALHLAAAANVIDVGATHQEDIDVHKAIRQALHERFIVDHTDAFRASLAKCRDLLFLLDNAGEIVFDKLLIEQLLKHTPVTAVVKAKPIINDAIMDDAVQVGLTDVCPVIDNGGAYIGAPPDLIPEHFRKRMERADVILGKGHGNYETLDDFPGDVFLLLRAKCSVVAKHMGVKIGQVGLVSTRVRGTM